MTRFFVDPAELNNEFMVLTGENATHAKVLRLKIGEKVTVCDGNGNECQCTITDINNDLVSLVVDNKGISTSEPSINVSVYMAFAKGDKFEHVVQKATELGASEIIAFPSARCVSRPDDKAIAKKAERWRKIAASAAEQSGRGCVPDILVMNSYKAALSRAATADTAILFYENERTTTLNEALKRRQYRSVSLLTGPEGGLEQSEVLEAEKTGLIVCSLGPRILRCETAPLCALSAVMYDSGEF